MRCFPLILSVALPGCGFQPEPAAPATSDTLSGTPTGVVEIPQPTDAVTATPVTESVESQEEAIAAIEALGGIVELDLEGDAYAVNLRDTQVSDAGLEHMKVLTTVKVLALDHTSISDAGLEHLRGLTGLEQLYLGNTQVSDTGLEHLKGLTSLTTLLIWKTQVTDAGLEHLMEMTSLQLVALRETSVTDSGVENLQAALPDCRIEK